MSNLFQIHTLMPKLFKTDVQQAYYQVSTYIWPYSAWQILESRLKWWTAVVTRPDTSLSDMTGTESRIEHLHAADW